MPLMGSHPEHSLLVARGDDELVVRAVGIMGEYLRHVSAVIEAVGSGETDMDTLLMADLRVLSTLSILGVNPPTEEEAAEYVAALEAEAAEAIAGLDEESES
ncbi:hypothetical protein ACWIGW_38750 [Nocardia brasiliensis]